MKATIDFEAALYRRLKIEAARRGRTIRDLVDEGVRLVLDMPAPAAPVDERSREPEWFGVLRDYAARAGGEHELPAIRRSIARRRSGQP